MTYEYTPDNYKLKVIYELRRVSDSSLPAYDADTDRVLYVVDTANQLQKRLKNADKVVALSHADNRQEDLSSAEYVIENIEEIAFDTYVRIYNRLSDLSCIIAQVEDYRLRETCVQDVDAFYEIYADPEITRYMENLYADREEEIAYTIDYIHNVYRFYEYGIWTIESIRTGEIIGRAGLNVREGYDIPELGFMVRRKYQGKKVATKVCGEVIRYAREELAFDTLQAFVNPDNEISIHLLKKLGFEVEEQVKLGLENFYRMIRR